MAENLITQTELEDYAPDLDLSSYSSATISGMISRASEQVRRYCNVAGFFKSAVTNEREKIIVNNNGEVLISFRRRPVVAADVSGLNFKGSDSTQAVNLTGSNGPMFYIPDPGGYMVLPSNYLISQGVNLLLLRDSNLYYELSYIGGYATDITDLPPDLKEAVTLYLRSMANRRLNSLNVQSFSQGSVSMNFGSKSSGVDANVAEAQQILNRGGFVRRTI